MTPAPETEEWGVGYPDVSGTMRVTQADDEEAARRNISRHGGTLMVRRVYTSEWGELDDPS